MLWSPKALQQASQDGTQTLSFLGLRPQQGLGAAGPTSPAPEAPAMASWGLDGAALFP